ncbi:cohesin domain-containing protein [Paenibacillus nicotianae]|uniref:Cohesin domain-containing protein n=1 Tax=Paenibacillus nicotianae TaxID=1526551 RepID=A0ABW4UZ51_9BACL
MKKRIFSHLSLFLSVLFVAVSVLTALPTATQAATKSITWENRSTTMQVSSSTTRTSLTNIGKTSGKWYWEVTVDNTEGMYAGIGISNANKTYTTNYYGNDGHRLDNFAITNAENRGYVYGSTYKKGDIISVALDIDNSTITWYKNGVSQTPVQYSSKEITTPIYAEIMAVNSSPQLTGNFGLTPFKYAIPNGYSPYSEDEILIGKSTLKATAGNAKVDLTWSTATNATSYNVKRATTTGGPYTNVATNVTGNTYYTDTTPVNGTPYFYVVTGVNGTTEGAVSNEVTATPIAAVKPNEQATLDVTIDKEKVKVGEGFIADLSLKKATNIYAEDFVVNYDATLMEYLGATEVPGYKVYNETNDKKGTLRFIVASQGKNYGISADTVFLKLKFKAIAVGTGKVDSLSGRIADTDNEYDIAPANALEDTILIEKPAFLDVNRSGSYTLLDLSIDAFYFGQNAADTDKTLHDADQTEDDQVGDDDLVYIVGQMLTNPDYTPNK